MSLKHNLCTCTVHSNIEILSTNHQSSIAEQTRACRGCVGVITWSADDLLIQTATTVCCSFSLKYEDSGKITRANAKCSDADQVGSLNSICFAIMHSKLLQNNNKTHKIHWMEFERRH